MKKKFLSVLLVLVMVLTMIPMATGVAFADGPSNWSLLATAMAGETQATVDGVFSVDDTTTPGVRKIQLLTDITATDSDSEMNIPNGKEIVFDLNGHTLNIKGEENAWRRAFNVSGKLTIMDSSDANKDGSGTGNIRKGFAQKYGGAVLVNESGILIIESGRFEYNKAREGKTFGGGAIACKGTLIINGGALCNNKARWGGAIGLGGNANFTMTGGKIYQNSALEMDGAAINMDYNGHNITKLYGGLIYDNISNATTTGIDEDVNQGIKSGGNAIWAEGTLELGGNVKIYSNKQGVYNKTTGEWSDIRPANIAILSSECEEPGHNLAKIIASSDTNLVAGAEIWLSKTSEHYKITPIQEGEDLTPYGITSENGFNESNIRYFKLDDSKGGYFIIAKEDNKFIAKRESAPSVGYFTYDVAQYNAILAEAMAQQAIIDAQLVPKEEPKTEEPAAEAKKLIEASNIRANTKATAKGTQVFATWLEGEAQKFIDAGYTVKYAFYRSTRAQDGYQLMLLKDEPVYTNTKGVRGHMYYYRAKLMVYDKAGNEVASTDLMDCKYGNRRFK